MSDGGDRTWPEREVDAFIGQISAGGQDYRRLVERLPVIVYSAEPGAEGRWHYVSPQVEDILGYSAEEFRATPGLWTSLLHPEDRERALGADRQTEGAAARRPVEYRMRTRDGSTVWMLDEAVLEEEDGVPVWHGVLYDITERKKAELGLQRALSREAAVARLGERALAGGDPDSLLCTATELLGELDGVDAVCIWQLDREGRSLFLRAGLQAERIVAGRRVSAARDSHLGAAVEAGAPAVVSDWRRERRFSMPPVLRAIGAACSLAVPIGGKEEPFGAIDLHSTEPGRLELSDAPFLQAAANVLADAFARHDAEQALRHRVLHDPLTGLPNRLSFIESLNAALRSGAAAGLPVGILFLDLDHFKLINDSFGHHAGDALLRTVAPRLRSCLRPGDVVARFGGDEFGVLIDRLGVESEAMAIAERVVSAFQRPFRIDGVEHFVSASIGVAVAGGEEDEVDAELLIRDADAAMYRAKQRGRARCVMFDAEMRAVAMRRMQTERELRHALERDELELFYQPVICLRTGEVTGLEALVRWHHPERGLLEPSEFVSVAEDSGLIEPIGRWVQERACVRALDWHAMRPDARPFDIAVNLSARQVAHRDLPATVSEIVARTGFDPRHLRLEITESVLLEESATALASLEALNEIGVRLVLDDFGTGYSSLAYLNRFPFHALKIDRSFVDALGIEQERTAIVEAIVGMARALSLEVIAEGVENEVQLHELQRLGCDYAQGHLFHAAMPDREVGRLIRTGAFDYSGTGPGR